MENELKQIIIGVVIFGSIIALIVFLKGRIYPDLSSDYEERTGQYYQDSGGGHPLWP